MTQRDATTGERLRVHRVIARLNVGGPAIHVVELNARLRDRGVETHLLAGALGPGEADMAYLADARGVEVRTVPGLSPEIRPLADLRALWSLFRTFRRERPHVVHTHTAKAGALGRLAAVMAGVPVRVHTYHGHVLGGAYFSRATTGLYRFLERVLGRITSRVLVLTESQREELVDHLGLDSARVRVVPLGFDLSRFLEPEGAAVESCRRRFGIPADVALIGIVGRLVPVKNHELMLHALARLRAGYDGPVKLLVVGGGDSERERALRTLADSLGVGDDVVWAGWVRDVETVYPDLDVLALTSLDEGTPVALIEGLASGCPTVARAVGGVTSLLAPGVVARFVDTEDPEAFALALRTTLENPPNEGARAAAQKEVARRFGIARLVADMAALYEELRVEIEERPGHLRAVQ